MITKVLRYFADMFARLILGTLHSAVKSPVSRLAQGRVCGAISEHVQRNTPTYIHSLILLAILLMARYANGISRTSLRDYVITAEMMGNALLASFGSWSSRLEAHRTSTYSAIAVLTIIWLRDGGTRLLDQMMNDTCELERVLNYYAQEGTEPSAMRPNTQQN